MRSPSLEVLVGVQRIVGYFRDVEGPGLWDAKPLSVHIKPTLLFSFLLSSFTVNTSLLNSRYRDNSSALLDPTCHSTEMTEEKTRKPNG